MSGFALRLHLERFGMDWRRVFLRGVITCLVGFSLALAAVFNPQASLLGAREFSWLPAGALFILIIGVLEFLDAAMAKTPADFFLHLQNGILDGVVGALIVFSVGDEPARASLLVAAFLMVKGLFRILLTGAIRTEKPISAWGVGGISLLLGALIAAEWPSTAGWFLAFCLGVEIGLRGAAVMRLALWLQAQPATASPPTGE